MCGIAGWYNYQELDETIISSIKSDLYHRGPDAQNHLIFGNSGLIHTRLSILDLSSKGNQPISNDDGTIYAVYNGEIYNYPELKESLISKGYVFDSTTDSEIIPKLYQEYGIESFNMLRGMFAFAIYDVKKNQLFLVRDRLGIKPMFYSKSNKSFFFASEIKALLNFPIKDRSINQQSIYDFASLNFIPAPATFFRSIHCLLPGEYIQASLRNNECVLESKQYFDIQIKPNFRLSSQVAVEKASKLLDRAVASQLASDVKLGSFLSAGIDSPLIANSASTILRHNLQTYTVSLNSSKYDESSVAQKISEKINSVHNNIEMEEIASLESIKNTLLSTGQPYADVSMFGVNVIAKAMKNNIKVALSGDGADEVFGGYYFFHRFEKKLLFKKLLKIFPFILAIFKLLTNTRIISLQRIGQKALRNSLISEDRMLVDFFTYITKEEREELFNNKEIEPLDRLFSSKQSIIIPKRYNTTKERISARLTEICFRLQLPNDFLFKVDHFTMQESLEVRVPMLDENLVEFGLTIPHRLKTRNNKGKFILREMYKKFLPAKLANRKKTGFFVPIFKLLDDKSREELKNYLLSENNRLKNYFNYDTYSSWVVDFFSDAQGINDQETRSTQKILMLLSLSLFLDQYE